MTNVSSLLARWRSQARFGPIDRGASLIEYALLIVLIAVVCLLAIQVIGGQTSTSLSKTGSGFTVAG